LRPSTILSASRALTQHSGHELQDVIGERPELLLGGDEGAALPEALWHSVALRGT